MNSEWKKQSRLIVLIFLCVFIAIASLLCLSFNSISEYNKDITTDMIIESKEIYMKETVDNFIIRMETLEYETIFAMDEHVRVLKETIIQNKTSKTCYEYVDELVKMHNHDTHIVNSLVYDNQDYKEMTGSKINYDQIINIENNSAVFEKIILDKYIVILYVSDETIYNITKDKVYTEIHNMEYERNQYMWINEIINYEGGDDYAIRLIHPNLTVKQGELLSTNTTDVYGNLPYLEELNGIIENGEVYHEYYFTNIINGEIGKKISYSKLYKDYNWIVAIGVPVEDLEFLVAEIDEKNNYEIKNNLIIIFVIFISGLLIIGYIFIKRQKKYLNNLDNIVKEEVERDILTNAYSRKYGAKYLNRLFNDYKADKINSSIYMIDIDNFKIINDTYGHDGGDIVLKDITKEIMKYINKDDYFIRWGGEEFILIVKNINSLNTIKLGNEIIEKIANYEFISNNIKFNVTLSIGVSSFINTDNSYEDVLKRADRLLYKAKVNGKNRMFINDENN